MNVNVVCVSSGEKVAARIVKPGKLVLPSINNGWRFNFYKHARKKGCEAYVLVCDDSPDVIEGCLVFQMKNSTEPYMAFVEVAPHNKGKQKALDNVAGCLIAFACQLSFTYGKDHFCGWLAFDVKEHRKEDEEKLMAVYCIKYGALRWGETTMFIPPENGKNLIAKFLNPEL
jgi:hypothetical protein